MEPIINPWLFYLIDVLFKLDRFLIIPFFVGGIYACFLFGVLLHADDNTDIIKAKRHFKVSATVFVIAAFLRIFIPTEETMYKMIISSYITPDNVNMVVDKTGEILEVSMTKLVDIITDGAVKIIESTK